MRERWETRLLRRRGIDSEGDFAMNQGTPAFPRTMNEDLLKLPEKLFYRGTIPDWDATKILGVIGTRQMTEYGKQVTQLFVRKFVEVGYVVASGMAVGVDAEAHRCTVALGGITIGVLPCGPASIMPREHQDLADQILSRDGLLLSEYQSSAEVQKWMFHRRNRVLAGLCDGILVIEAGAKSGTLITAGYAAEFGRPVWVVPSAITSPFVEGTKRLINLGATMVTDPQEIVSELEQTTQNSIFV